MLFNITRNLPVNVSILVSDGNTLMSYIKVIELDCTNIYCIREGYRDEFIYSIYISITNNIPIKYAIDKYNVIIMIESPFGFNNSTVLIEINKKTYTIPKYTYFSKDSDELYFLVTRLIEIRGNECNLNDIDVSEITNMDSLFYNVVFNGDISKWNVSNVVDMSRMFRNSKFNGDISDWNVSNVVDMDGMFINSPLENNKPTWFIRG